VNPGFKVKMCKYSEIFICKETLNLQK